MSCHLSIIGENLDIDALLKQTKLEPYKKTYKGHPKFVTRPDGEKMKYSLISVEVSKAAFEAFDRQVEDALSFLRENSDKLSYISSFNDIQYAVLCFGIENDESKFCQDKHLPKELIKLAGELGLSIELSIYQKASNN